METSKVYSCVEQDDGVLHTNERVDLDEFPRSKVCAWSRSSSKLAALSPQFFSNGFKNLSSLIWSLGPVFVRSGCEKTPGKQETLHHTAYLDGMRGLAAFAVFLCHLSYDAFDITRVYGTGGPGQNNWFFQLPIVRLLYSGPPMVAIFFVISGYALSYKPLKLMRSGQYDALLTAMTSSAFRRPLRLFLPCFASTLIVSVMAQLGIFQMTEGFRPRITHEDHPHTASNPFAQLRYWVEQMFEFVNVFDWATFAGAINLDRHLWTIPAEFRCSMALFLTHLMVARMSSRSRITTVSLLFWWGMRWNRWDMCPFWAGMILAELDLIKLAREKEALNPATAEPDSWRTSISLMHSRLVDRCGKGIYLPVFVVALFLASYPDLDGHIAPGYVYLTQLIPEYWVEKHRFWANIAAILIVWSAGNHASLRNIFNCQPIQYLGKISFPLYVMHGPIIHTWGYALMNYFFGLSGFDSNHLAPYRLAFCAAALPTIVMTIWCADLFLRRIDEPCVRFAKWLDRRLLDS